MLAEFGRPEKGGGRGSRVAISHRTDAFAGEGRPSSALRTASQYDSSAQLRRMECIAAMHQRRLFVQMRSGIRFVSPVDGLLPIVPSSRRRSPLEGVAPLVRLLAGPQARHFFCPNPIGCGGLLLPDFDAFVPKRDGRRFRRPRRMPSLWMRRVSPRRGAPIRTGTKPAARSRRATSRAGSRSRCRRARRRPRGPRAGSPRSACCPP